MLGHERGNGLAEALRVLASLADHQQGHGAGPQHSRAAIGLGGGDPQLRQFPQNLAGSHGGAHYGFLHACPRRASISSDAAGPQVPDS